MLAEASRGSPKCSSVLYANGRWAVLIVLQGMDAAGKDGVIKHVMSGINPQGCEVHAFKAPSSEELEHDFLWRAGKHLPERGRIGIFNRSHYEEVLVVRVHPDMLERQKLPPSLIGKDIWKHRFKEIRAFERHLAAQRHADPEIPSAHFEGGAAQALPGAARRAGQTLEVLDGRRHRAPALGRLHGGL